MKRERQIKVEFGDFQTPLNLTRDVCSVIVRTGFLPASVIEPTCGRGAFLQAALEAFPNTTHFLGVERNDEYVQHALTAAGQAGNGRKVQILQCDFFDADWMNLVAGSPKPLLILGNPPWVTNAAIGALNGANLPAKTNLDNLRGLDALTGKSNFDISEWMLRKNLEWLADTPGMLAVLCKTAVARRVLFHAWSQTLPIESAELRRIDAKLYFGAAVDACLLIVKLQPGASSKQCDDYSSLLATEPQSVFGLRDGMLVADVQLYDRRSELLGCGLSGWRSGIKHDSSDVFELTPRDGGYENGLGVHVDIENDLLFPLLKSSDLAGNRRPRKWLLVPQRTITGSPEDLQRTAPKAWQYLLANAARLAGSHFGPVQKARLRCGPTLPRSSSRTGRHLLFLPVPIGTGMQFALCACQFTAGTRILVGLCLLGCQATGHSPDSQPARLRGACPRHRFGVRHHPRARRPADCPLFGRGAATTLVQGTAHGRSTRRLKSHLPSQKPRRLSS